MNRFKLYNYKFNLNSIYIIKSKRLLSQHLTISTKNKHVSYSVNMLKVPSNYGYYTSRVNRLYNEDRYSVHIMDINLNENKIKINNDENENLYKRIYDSKPPIYEEYINHGIRDSNNNDNYDDGEHLSKVFNFSIYDGHGGSECAEYVKNHLMENIESFKISSGSIIKLFNWYAKEIGGYWRRWNKKKNLHIISSMGLEQRLNNSLRGNQELKKILNDNSNKGIAINNNSKDNKDKDNKLIWEIDELDELINGEDFFKLKIYLSFLFTDFQFLNYELKQNEIRQIESNESSDLYLEQHSGSTCTSCFFYKIDGDLDSPNSFFYQPNILSKLLVAHIGDTRAIICDKEGIAHGLTTDHHPSNPIENRRLQRYSTGLMMTDSFGEERFVNFANTRSFGDVTAKNLGITSEPEFSEFLIGDSNKLINYKKIHRDNLKNRRIMDFGGDECFIVLITDGVSNYLSDQEIVDLIMTSTNNKGSIRGTPHEACKDVVKFVEDIGGDDNATCTVVKLSGWGKWPIIDRTGAIREKKMMNVPRRG